MKSKALAPYVCHGLDLKPSSGDEWVADCPKCGKVDHFYVNEDSGQCCCKVCGFKGNVVTFLEYLAANGAKSLTDDKAKIIAKEFGLPVKAIRAVGFGYVHGRWVLPARNSAGRVNDLRRWPSGPARQFHSTAKCDTQLLGADELARKQGEDVWVCEGDKDYVAWKWVLNECKSPDAVVGVPGADTFKEEWCRLFEGRRVRLLYDNDDAGREGDARARKMLDGLATEIASVKWPDDKPVGWDTRDVVKRSRTPAAALAKIKELMHTPDGEMADDSGTPATLDDVREALSNYAVINDDMMLAMRVMLAVCVSNALHSDPLWVYIVGASSHGKTLLADSFETAKCVVMRSSIKPQNLVSGFKQAEGERDPGLIAQAKDKTIVVKDWTELLSLPQNQKDEAFSILRGAFDGSVERSYGNAVHRKYNDHRFSMIACVTHRIHAESQAHMGERFLKFQFKRMTEDLQDEVSMRAMDHINDDEPKKVIKRVVASFLRRKFDPASAPTLTEAVKRKILALSKVISLLRTNVERNWQGDPLYRPQPEASARLCKQLAKLGRCLAFVDGRSQVDDDTFRTIKRVAFDTAYGFHLDIIDGLVDLGGRGTQAQVAELIDLPTSTLARRFEDLCMLEAITKTTDKLSHDGRGRPSTVYAVTERMVRMWDDIKERRCKGKQIKLKRS